MARSATGLARRGWRSFAGDRRDAESASGQARRSASPAERRVRGRARPDPARPRRRRDRGRRSKGQAHERQQALLAGARHHEGRPAPVLRRRLALAPATPAGPRDGHEALPPRRGGGVLLHEAGPQTPSGVAPTPPATANPRPKPQPFPWTRQYVPPPVPPFRSPLP